MTQQLSLTESSTNSRIFRLRQLDSEIKDDLVPKHTSCSNLYFLPKIHKPNNPGRPVVSGCACPTTQISKLVDYFLRPLVQALPSPIQDTTHFINHINQINQNYSPFVKKFILVTAYVTSLCTNIPHNEGPSLHRSPRHTFKPHPTHSPINTFTRTDLNP